MTGIWWPDWLLPTCQDGSTFVLFLALRYVPLMLVGVTMSLVGNFAAVHAFPTLVWQLYVDAAIVNRPPLPPRHKLTNHDATEQATTARVRATMATMGMLTPTASHGRVHPETYVYIHTYIYKETYIPIRKASCTHM